MATASHEQGGLDTNVLVRYLVEDDPNQFEAARRYIEEHCTPEVPGLVHPVMLCEVVWVLRSAYQVPREAIVDALDTLLRIRSLKVLEAELVRKALGLYRSTNVDFADAYLHAAYRQAVAVGLLTFDRRAGALPGATRL